MFLPALNSALKPALTPAVPLADTPLKDLLGTDLRLADVFNRHGLDFCCHGHQTVAQAAATAHAVLADVEADIAQHQRGGTGRALEAEQWPVAFLAEYIERIHHAFTHATLAALTPAVEKILHKHGAAHPELATVAGLYAQLVAELEPHLLQEERVLFPYLRGLASPLPAGAARLPIETMVHEHDDAGTILYHLAATTNQFVPPADACATYRFVYRKLRELDEDLRVHIHLENNILFPKALAMEAAAASRDRSSPSQI